MRHDLWHMIGALIDLGIGDDQQNPCRRTLDQAACSLKHGNARAFGTDQRAGYVEALFRKKKIQVVSRTPARNLRIALSNQIAVLIPQRFQSGVNPASPAAFPNDCVQFLIAGLTYFHSQAIVCQDLQFLDVVIRLPRHDRVHATRVVTNHSAQSATVMRSGIRSEGQVVLLSGVAQMVENYTGLHPSDAARWIDLQNLRHVLGEIQHDSNIAALPGKRSSAAAAEDGRAEFPRQRNSRDHIIGIAGQHDSDRYLAIVRSVSGIKRAAARVEAHFAAKMPAQCRFEPSRIYLSSFSCMGEFGKVLLHPKSNLEFDRTEIRIRARLQAPRISAAEAGSCSIIHTARLKPCPDTKPE